MDKQYSVKFFTSFLESLQDHCNTFLEFNHLVEVSGYVCVEIDNVKKERYVLSELVQSCGNVISESYCTKAFKTPATKISENSKKYLPQGTREKDRKLKLKAVGRTDVKSQKTPDNKRGGESVQDAGLGFKIASVSSLAVTAKEMSPTEESSVNQDELKEKTDEHKWSLKESPHTSNIFQPKSSQYSQEGWEGRDTFVYNIPADKPKNSGTVQLMNSENKLSESSQVEPRSPWPEDQQNLDLDQLLSEGQEWTSNTAQTVTFSSCEDVDMSDTGAPEPSPSDEEADDDLTVLNEQYFTAQMLAHTSQVPDTKVFPQETKTPAPLKSVDELSVTEPSPSPSMQISMRSPHVVCPLPQQQAPVSQGSCVVVIDEDSDDVVDVDMGESSDDDISEFSQEALGDLRSQTPSGQKSVLSDEERQRKKYKSSLKYQRYAVNLFNDFQKKRGEGIRPIQTMHPEKLDEVLAEFYSSLRKSNGEEFGSMSLRNVQSHLERYLKDANYPFSITKDDQFQNSRKILREKIAEAKARAKPRNCTRVTGKDISIMFQTGELGTDSPESLLNSMWFMNNMFLHIKQNFDHYNLRWGDVRLCKTGFGLEMLECVNGKSKGRKVFSDEYESERCFVTLYKTYRDRRPPSTLTDDAPFYLCPAHVFTATGPWFSANGVSVSRLTGVLNKMAEACGLRCKKLP
ncbi:uncharacterized protein LOC124149198 isoform X2 [Haliotis rufescens]|uniref:uncharacterized protein LOC124149198 isoform X2 n=1 Tax=Haliotis rufescens TaxID=6454 RepID=UPI001EB02643|nr:uncharacterized protein LOC124149198 isoform X2 [Haliotis rufescens]